MKKGLIFILFLVAHTSVKSQIATALELPKIFNSALVDSTEKTERLAAIYFHEQINKYRASKLKKKLGWNDTLWLAARNHCSWMMENNKLSHEEKKEQNYLMGMARVTAICLLQEIQGLVVGQEKMPFTTFRILGS